MTLAWKLAWPLAKAWALQLIFKQNPLTFYYLFIFLWLDLKSSIWKASKMRQVLFLETLIEYKRRSWTSSSPFFFWVDYSNTSIKSCNWFSRWFREKRKTSEKERHKHTKPSFYVLWSAIKVGGLVTTSHLDTWTKSKKKEVRSFILFKTNTERKKMREQCLNKKQQEKSHKGLWSRFTFIFIISLYLFSYFINT